MKFIEILELVLQEGAEIDALKQEIDANEPATAPPIHTFIDSHGGNVGLTWTPDKPAATTAP